MPIDVFTVLHAAANATSAVMTGFILAASKPF